MDSDCEWAALEPPWASRAARSLLAIEVLPKGQATVPPTMSMLTRASVKRAELLGLVEDALRDHLRTGAMSNTERAGDTSVEESKRASYDATTTTRYSLSN